jgi:hypothetical protein
MNRHWSSLIVALCLVGGIVLQDGSFPEKQKAIAATVSELRTPGASPPDKTGMSSPGIITIQTDRNSLNNGGVIRVTGTAPVGRPVYLEVWADRTVSASRFDADMDEETGKRPYILYLTTAMPAYYKLFAPKDQKEAVDTAKKEGSKWSFSKVLKETGADAVYSTPATIRIDRYQATLMGSIIGSRGTALSPLDDRENRKRSMQLVKARFRSVDKVLGAEVQMNPDGTYRAEITIRQGLAPGTYKIAAAVDTRIRTQPVEFENKIDFPLVYLANGGTSINLFGPFLLTLAIAIFGVLMGAGGGFILNPLLISLWPLPHTVVAGTVMPTVLFSQGSGIYNYSKIKFINWKLGVAIGLAMVVGGFIGPKLTELITLEQFKFVFGWILLALAGLMFWQTTPEYLARNKQEQAILNEFKKNAENAVKQR